MARPHKQPFGGFGCDSVSLEGKAPLLRRGAVGDATAQPETTTFKALDLEERLNHTKCTETHGWKKPVIQHF